MAKITKQIHEFISKHSVKLNVMEHSQQLIPFLLSSADANFPIPFEVSMDDLVDYIDDADFDFESNIVSRKAIALGVIDFLCNAKIFERLENVGKLTSVRLTSKGICLLKRKVNVNVSGKDKLIEFRYFIRNFALYEKVMLADAVENALVGLEMDWRQ
jgi:hypothetical protein